MKINIIQRLYGMMIVCSIINITTTNAAHNGSVGIEFYITDSSGSVGLTAEIPVDKDVKCLAKVSIDSKGTVQPDIKFTPISETNIAWSTVPKVIGYTNIVTLATLLKEKYTTKANPQEYEELSRLLDEQYKKALAQ